jgi:selenocysteine lyase/cysteine desulfurase
MVSRRSTSGDRSLINWELTATVKGKLPVASQICNTSSTDTRRFESATASNGVTAELAAGLGYIHQIGIANIEAHGVRLGLKLQQGLTRMGHRLFTPMGNHGPIVAFYLSKPASPDWQKLLDELAMVFVQAPTPCQPKITRYLCGTACATRTTCAQRASSCSGFRNGDAYSNGCESCG